MILLSLGLACAKLPPPPPLADAAIPLTGEHVRLEAVDDHKYLHYAVGRSIDAPPDVVWAVLTDADDYTRWNSTLVRLDGEIALDEKLKLTAKIAPKRTFKLTVSTFDPASRMVWEDGNNMFRGVRSFTLQANDDGGTDWTMKEAFSGSMMKMIAGKLPDFGPDFDAFARDLEAEAERRASAD